MQKHNFIEANCRWSEEMSMPYVHKMTHGLTLQLGNYFSHVTYKQALVGVGVGVVQHSNPRIW